MKRVISLFLILGVFLLISSVHAQSNSDLDEELQKFIKKVAEKKGINEDKIKKISKVNFSKLPGDVSIENIDDSNLGIYEVEAEGSGSVFVITASDENIPKIIKPVQYYTTSLLSFGFKGESEGSSFLNTPSGVLVNDKNGYVMPRSGSITGISTSLEVVSGFGEIRVYILKNGEAAGFGNLIEVSSKGAKKDFDIQSRGIVEFKAGDVISVYVKTNGNIVWKDAINLVEISN